MENCLNTLFAFFNKIRQFLDNLYGKVFWKKPLKKFSSGVMLIQMVVHLVLILFWPSDVLLERLTIRVHQ